MPRFSIVIPAYNVGAYLERCLASVVGQAFGDWEAIVVDDASTDDTPQVAARFAEEDARVRVVRHEANRGLHLVRRTGVEAASGDWALFLDGDDELADLSVLEALSAASGVPKDQLVRFDLAALAENGTPEEARAGFERWSNADTPLLDRRELLRQTFEADGGYTVSWHMHHRLIPTALARRAFSLMTDRRLERAEDAYEFLVLASLCSGERHVPVRGYLYHMGTGVTSSLPMGTGQFAREAAQVRSCAAAALSYAQDAAGRSDDDLVGPAKGLREKLLETLANNLNERVPEADRPEAARTLADAFGRDACACELWRFVRDAAYDDYTHGATEPGERTKALLREARAVYDPTGTAPEAADALAIPEDATRCDDMRERAQVHLTDIARVGRRAAYEAQDIRIFVTTHKAVDVPASLMLQPVQVGPGNAAKRFPLAFHDDEGDNIASLNPSYCEMTTQYWAWKNTSSPYVGFCHYRRYFSFSATAYEENPYGEVMDDYIDADAVARYGLDDEHIRRGVEGYDIVTTGFKDLRDFPGDFETPREHYEAAPLLHVEDLDRCMAIVRRLHPDYAEDVVRYLTGHTTCFCNMYVLRRELFDDYCSFVFPVLEEWCRETDMGRYGREAVRTPGHLAERLFNVWYLHTTRTRPELRCRQLQCVHFEHPEPAPVARQPFGHGGLRGRDVVPVVFAADDGYTAQLCCAVGSMAANASRGRTYDVYVLTSGISWEHQEAIRRHLAALGRDDVRLTFFDVSRLIRGHQLDTNNAHISQETYYRFLVQEILPFYDKVVYLDSDLVVEGDVAQLFDTELGCDLVAATRDVDYLGNLNVPGGNRMDYSTDVLGMRDPYAYFQAGVLVLNTRELRRVHSIDEWLDVASNPAYIYNDQDVLNVACEGRVRYLDASWNVTNDTFDRVGRIYALAPAAAYDAYLASRAHPKVVHFAGAIKPWGDASIDLAEHFWRVARETPFYEELLQSVARSNAPKPPAPTQHEPVMSDDNPIRKIVDPIAPLGSPQRELMKAVGRAVLGKR